MTVHWAWQLVILSGILIARIMAQATVSIGDIEWPV
jgi:hypothetical protein